MRTHTEGPADTPMRIAGVSLLVLAGVCAVAVIARSIPTSYANIPGEGASTRPRTLPGGPVDLRPHDSQPRPAPNPENRIGCPECAVIASMHQIEPAPRAWPPGNRVVAIRGAKASNK